MVTSDLEVGVQTSKVVADEIGGLEGCLANVTVLFQHSELLPIARVRHWHLEPGVAGSEINRSFLRSLVSKS